MKSILSLFALAATALPAAACPYASYGYSYGYAQSYSYAPAAAVVTYNLVTPYAPVAYVPAQVQCNTCPQAPAVVPEKQVVPVTPPVQKQAEVQPMSYRNVAVQQQVVANYAAVPVRQVQVQASYGYGGVAVAAPVRAVYSAPARAVVVRQAAVYAAPAAVAVSPASVTVINNRVGLLDRIRANRAARLQQRANVAASRVVPAQTVIVR